MTKQRFLLSILMITLLANTRIMAEIKMFTASSTIRDVMNAPAFGDFGKLLFPANRSYWSGETLGDLRLT